MKRLHVEGELDVSRVMRYAAAAALLAAGSVVIATAAYAAYVARLWAAAAREEGLPEK